MGDTPSEGAFWTRIAQKGLDGSDGTDGGDGADGSEVELQKGTTHIQWRYVGGTTWTDLVALDDLKGAAGSNGADGRGYNLAFTSLNIDVSMGLKTLVLGSMAQPGNSPNMVAALATAYSTGNRVRLSANSSTWIEGQMSIISPSGMYAWGLTVTKISGSGTYSTWTVSIAGEPGLDGGVTSYTQLADKPTLGTAAATAASDYATAAQGAKADSALQLGDPVFSAWNTSSLDFATAVSGLSREWEGIIYANSRYIAISPTQVANSANGLDWTLANAASQSAWEHIAYGNGIFVAVATKVNSPSRAPAAMYSVDGLNWTLSNSLPAAHEG